MLIYYCVVEGKGIVENFLGFYRLVNVSAEAITYIMCNEIKISMGHEKSKFIAQMYNGPAVMSGSQRG